MIGCFFYSSSINVTIVLKKVTRTSNLYGIRLGFRTVYNIKFSTDIFIIVVVQSLSHVRLFVTLWIAARQASVCFTTPWSLLRLTSTELMMPSHHLVLCHLLLILPSIFPSIRVFSNESALRIRWPKYYYNSSLYYSWLIRSAQGFQ